MRWFKGLEDFVRKHGREFTLREQDLILGKPWVEPPPNAWMSWMGTVWKKYEGKMPEPEEVGMNADDPFFDPEFIDIVDTRNSSLQVVRRTYWRRDRILRSVKFFR